MHCTSCASVCAGQEIADLLAKIEFCKSNCFTDDMQIMRCCAQAINMQRKIVALAQLTRKVVKVWCCREKIRRQVHVKFNNWELEGDGGAWFEMEKADAPHDEGADWW